MDVYEAIRTRGSTRAYRDCPVESEKLARILEAARLAPSARNIQAWKLVVVQDPAARRALAEAAEQAFVAAAPVVIAVVAMEPARIMHCGVPSAPVDTAIVADHITLAATAEGLGTCWICHFDQARCRKLLGVPLTAMVMEMILLGYPEGTPGPKKRKSIEEIVCNERLA
ncbi:MAG: nitroreductase family protein [Planctomycetota bacterium]|nr:nitroreductase family protein [Planctomycetota bacterium]